MNRASTRVTRSTNVIFCFHHDLFGKQYFLLRFIGHPHQLYVFFYTPVWIRCHSTASLTLSLRSSLKRDKVLWDVILRFPLIILSNIAKLFYTIESSFIIFTVIDNLLHHIRLWFDVVPLGRFSLYSTRFWFFSPWDALTARVFFLFGIMSSSPIFCFIFSTTTLL